MSPFAFQPHLHHCDFRWFTPGILAACIWCRMRRIILNGHKMKEKEKLSFCRFDGTLAVISDMGEKEVKNYHNSSLHVVLHFSSKLFFKWGIYLCALCIIVFPPSVWIDSPCINRNLIFCLKATIQLGFIVFFIATWIVSAVLREKLSYGVCSKQKFWKGRAVYGLVRALALCPEAYSLIS